MVQKSVTKAETTTEKIPERYGGDTGREWGDLWPYPLRLLIGVVLTANFVVFWMLPIGFMGQIWRDRLSKLLRPVYNYMDNHKGLRAFAKKYIYTRDIHADFITQAILIFIGWGLPFLYIIHQQVTYGTLTWKQIYFYYFCWVGFGGRVMGGAYTFAHKEGHNPSLYKPWIANTFGNVFENIIGPFFGNVPYNFTTSHIYIHHKLQAGTGDTFYQWDLDRTSWKDFMIFIHRIILHTTGISSLLYFLTVTNREQARLLTRGIIMYWVVYPAILLYITSFNLSFMFYIYIQPMVGMTFFLAFMNFAFHVFLDYNEDGRNLWCVSSTTIVGGDDDYFGEDDHMAHHHATHKYWRELPQYRDTKVEDFKEHNAAVFQGLSIVELAFLFLFREWKTLAKHYVQYHPEHEEQSKMNDVVATKTVNLSKGNTKTTRRTAEESAQLIKEGSEDLTETFKMSKWNYTGRMTEDEVIAMMKARATRREPLRTPYVHKFD